MPGRYELTEKQRSVYPLFLSNATVVDKQTNIKRIF